AYPPPHCFPVGDCLVSPTPLGSPASLIVSASGGWMATIPPEITRGADVDNRTDSEACVLRSAAIDILLVGGRREVRERLRSVLDSEPGFRVVADASSAGQALRANPDVEPDVVIVMPSGGPLARTMRVLRGGLLDGHRVRTIVLTSAAERASLQQARELGVSQVLSASTSRSLLIDTVRLLGAGGQQTLDERAGQRNREPIHGNPFGLTTRELEVVEAVVRSFLNNLN